MKHIQGNSVLTGSPGPRPPPREWTPAVCALGQLQALDQSINKALLLSHGWFFVTPCRASGLALLKPEASSLLLLPVGDSFYCQADALSIRSRQQPLRHGALGLGPRCLGDASARAFLGCSLGTGCRGPGSPLSYSHVEGLPCSPTCRWRAVCGHPSSQRSLSAASPSVKGDFIVAFPCVSLVDNEVKLLRNHHTRGPQSASCLLPTSCGNLGLAGSPAISLGCAKPVSAPGL